MGTRISAGFRAREKIAETADVSSFAIFTARRSEATASSRAGATSPGDRVLKRGGRVALSTWATDNPSQTWCNEVLRPFVYAPEAKELPAKFDSRFDTPLQLETALRQAGFANTQISVKEKDFVYADEEQYWSSLWSSGWRRQLEKMTPELLEQARSAVFQKVQKFKKPDGFHKLNRTLFTLGTKPP